MGALTMFGFGMFDTKTPRTNRMFNSLKNQSWALSALATIIPVYKFIVTQVSPGTLKLAIVIPVSDEATQRCQSRR